MGVQRLNHAVLYVRDVQRSIAFYGEVLGFEPVDDLSPFPTASFLRAPGSTNDHDLGLFEVGATAADSAAGRGAVGLYHLAWEVDTLGELERIAEALQESGALTGATDHATTKALYARDPDGLEFEVSWLVPAERLTDELLRARSRLAPLDLPGEIARYGADTLGGVGVSHAEQR